MRKRADDNLAGHKMSLIHLSQGLYASRRISLQMPKWLLIMPCVGLLFVWTTFPLLTTIYYSFQRYNLLNPMVTGSAGIKNYTYLFTDPSLYTAIANTLILVGSVVFVTIVVGTLLAVLFDKNFPGRNIARVLAISPFFVMPTVAALIWKNLLMHPIYGVFASMAKGLGLSPVDWFTQWPLLSVVIIVSWQWIPFAALILITAMQSLDGEQMEAARMDGARGIVAFRYIVLPFLARPIAIVVLIETIFLFSVFAEILVTTGGGPGLETTNLTYLIYTKAILEWNIGGASAAGIASIVVANAVAFGLVATVARNFAK
ncbi:carbohydrate ABC transporter permease [Agrobacterium tumefaciens]|uniref:carbohydrate ABC transporter permease n=1 Tax=Agrobacterium tumefaciens TaxID=358 RepID=UPI003BA36E9F